MTPVRSSSSSLSGGPAGVGNCLVRRADPVNDEPVHFPLVFRRNMIVRIKRTAFAVADRHLAGDFHRQVGYVEALDGACPGFAVQDSPPDIIDAGSQGGNRTDACYDNTSKFHIYAFKLAARSSPRSSETAPGSR